MLLSEPQTTPLDIGFRVAGVPVRVSGLFWLGTVLIGWNVCEFFAGGDRRGVFVYLAMWCAVVLGSILIHELGHALAFARFGQPARIVLYHFGGLAIPETWGRRRHLRPAERFLVSAAGPFAQLLVAAAVILLLKGAGMVVPFPFASVGRALGFDEGRGFASRQALALFNFILYVNICWPVLNLIPVPPLDGGQMAREALETLGVRDSGRIAAGIGMVAGGLVAFWALRQGDRWLGIMFAMLAVACFQELQRSPPWRRWN